MPHECEGLRGLWHSCPSPVVVDPASGMHLVVDAAVVVFIVGLTLVAVAFGAWISSMAD